ncbi:MULTISPECIES: sugar ABC transporter ATP-binding protein [Halanaerobium]|jgi:rhamnose transport system ATP-binding protein|uniref:Monosaccharide ABC transporter ATP-binding protein, CUT2 family n=1 Tax=Halanaerobium kushneri TaxID=56779 RepID=A0A1N6QSN0_9FIRM|nr:MULTISPECIES: sugar ABC transporter ATP-binding protein [Halanaerobium]RCW61055.1 monosaccharide ABC transporter ATP-binding protein (CUT2 family) [Halanaerobium sp. ST460_2HS_T2]SIQ19604.1 monosaccharide ABC transporter ATP-binding protein, CUT2 family [Halanaerobium kushneri]
MSKYILELKNITKTFPGVKALDNVNFQLKAGEIHALMGENGAGKSTFIKVITGVHQPNGGEIYLNGEKINIKNPNDSKDLGIAAIYQHATSYPHLSVTENIFMGHEKIDSSTKRILWEDMHKAAEKHLQELGAEFDPRRRMSTLSVAQQQIVEIAKAISTNAEIIIMDEPTASLTKTESEDLYRITEKLQKIGTSIIFISHRFEDMYRLADRVTVLRDSQYIGTWGVNEVSNKDLIKAMVGREINQLFPKTEKEIGQEIMRVENLNRKGFFKDISFSLKEGEILAITGLVGAGRTELCESLFGLAEYDSGKIYFENQEVKINEVRDAMKLGIGYLPEDRQEQGLILDWELDKNITLTALDKISKNGWINRKKEKSIAKKLAEKVNVKARSIFDLAKQLSGGNQQKVVVAKLLTSDLKVIILDEPTKGVDVGAKSQIFEIMSDLAAQGYAIIMVSSEMPEVLGMGDRILVMRNGEITAKMNVEEADQEKILEAAMKEKK